MSFEDSDIYKAILDGNEEELQLAILKEDASQRNETGLTFLHFALELRCDVNIIKTLLKNADITHRDANGNTILDLVANNDYDNKVEEAVQDHIDQILEDGDPEKLEELILAGLDIPRPSSGKRRQIKENSEDVDALLEKLETFGEKVKDIHYSIEAGDLRSLKISLDRKKLAIAKDVTGLTPLHKAVVYNHTDAVRYIIEKFPDTLNLQDNLGRTPLHYAAPSRDGGHLFKILQQAGATDDKTDLRGNLASYYKENPEELDLKEFLAHIQEIKNKPHKKLRSRPSSRTALARSVGTQRSRPSTRGSGRGSPKSVKSDHKSEKCETPANAGTPDTLRSCSVTFTEIPDDPFRQKNIPEPKTCDSLYARRALGDILTDALAEIVDHRPWDPIEYLSLWLYNYAKNRDDKIKAESETETLERERAEMTDSRSNTDILKAEILSQKDEDKKREKEKAEEEKMKQDGSLAPVREEEDADEASTSVADDTRDEQGKTALHYVAAEKGSDIQALLRNNPNVGIRDYDHKTARDLAVENDVQENVEAIDEFVCGLFEKGQLDAITALVLNSYTDIPDIIEKYGPGGFGIDEDAFDFYKSISNVQEKIKKAHEGAVAGEMRSVKLNIDRKQMALSYDKEGLSVLHKAVLFNKLDVVEYLIETFPNTILCKDHFGRTPLHYAYAVDDKLVELLEKAENTSGNKSEDDLLKHSPEYYKENKDVILNLRNVIPGQGDDEEGEKNEDEEENKDGEDEEKKDDEDEDKPEIRSETIEEED